MQIIKIIVYSNCVIQGTSKIRNRAIKETEANDTGASENAGEAGSRANRG